MSSAGEGRADNGEGGARKLGFLTDVAGIPAAPAALADHHDDRVRGRRVRTLPVHLLHLAGAGGAVGIDAVGFQAHNRRHPGQEDPRQVMDDLARLINPTGRLAVIGVFTSADAAPSPHDGFDRRVDGVVKVVFIH